MTTYYTGRGDSGTSNILGGSAMGKDDPVFDAIGEMDELNSFIGISLLYVTDNMIVKDLTEIQDNIFSISAMLANINGSVTIGKLKVPSTEMLEREIARIGATLPELKEFVLPRGGKSASYLHAARAIARRAERKLVSFRKIREFDDGIIKYVNRLSSFLFVAALYVNNSEHVSERNPDYK